MNVLQKATNWLADLQTTELVLLRELGKVRGAKDEAVKFIDMYRKFDVPEESRPAYAPDGQAAEYAVVTPAAAERVTAEEGPDTSSAQSQANAGAEATVREEVQPAPMAEVEPVSRLAAGRTADAEEAGSGPGASSAPIPEPKVPVADQILALQAEHPDWTAKDFAEAIGVSSEHINAAARKRGGIVIAKIKPRGPSGGNPTGLSLRQRVENDLAEHPNSTCREIGDRLGIHQKHIASIARNNDLAVRKLTPEELLESRRLGGANGGAALKAARAKPVEAREPPPAPTPPPEPERPPASTPQPSGVVTKPMARAPRGTQFRLRTGRGEGKYLHQSGVGLVPGRTYSWMGSESQLLAVRQKFPEARDLYEEIVEKEPARV